MKIKTIYSQEDSSRSLPNTELTILAKSILKNNLSLKPQENLLIITDPSLLSPEASSWFYAGQEIGATVTMPVLVNMTHSGQEPPSEILNLCQKADVVILHTAYSLTHTKAGKSAQKYNLRVASLPTVDQELMTRTLKIDYQTLQQTGQKLKNKLASRQIIRIKSKAGTDITAKIRQNQIFNDCGLIQSGQVGNLPAGEVFFAPILGSANGTWIINGSLADFDQLKQPIRLTIKAGRAVDFSGGRAATELKQRLTAIGPEAFNIAEIGIGTNPETNPFGDMIEAEKAYGTAHLALGNNSTMGGKIDVPIHLDGLTLEPTINLDQEQIMKSGKLLIH
jgi:leucyl aminopeptidase (aminopeptidase T)